MLAREASPHWEMETFVLLAWRAFLCLYVFSNCMFTRKKKMNASPVLNKMGKLEVCITASRNIEKMAADLMIDEENWLPGQIRTSCKVNSWQERLLEFHSDILLTVATTCSSHGGEIYCFCHDVASTIINLGKINTYILTHCLGWHASHEVASNYSIKLLSSPIYVHTHFSVSRFCPPIML